MFPLKGLLLPGPSFPSVSTFPTHLDPRNFIDTGWLFLVHPEMPLPVAPCTVTALRILKHPGPLPKLHAHLRVHHLLCSGVLSTAAGRHECAVVMYKVLTAFYFRVVCLALSPFIISPFQ